MYCGKRKMALCRCQEKNACHKHFMKVSAFYNHNIIRLRLNKMGPISERIKLLRETLHLSQAEFAKKLRITRGHVSNLGDGPLRAIRSTYVPDE